MSDSQKPAPPAAANQTIQLDALDPAEAEAIAAGASSRPSEAPSRRKTPPPLPPSVLVSTPPPADAPPPVAAGAPYAEPAAAAPRAVSVVPPPPRPMGQKIGLGAMFVVLVAGAVYLGLQVGTRARGPSASPSVSVSAVPPAAASDQVLELPTIEMAAPQGSK